MTEPLEYDVVVIGAGPVGENVVDRTRAAGLSTAIVESELAGGECSYWACMPSKALLRPVVARAEARGVPGLRAAVQGGLDLPAVFSNRDAFTSNWKDDGQVGWIKDTGTDFYRGHGRLAGERRVTVATPGGEEITLTARHAVVVATGSRAAVPPLPGVAGANVWTSREATSAKEAPARLVVVGGGVVGAEMATAYLGFGSQVTLLIRGDRALAGMEPFAGEMLVEALTAAGADVRMGAALASVERSGGSGPVTVVLDSGERIEADEVLFATGRAPRTEDIGLDTVGLEPGSWLKVEETCQVEGHSWLYAVGDVNHRALLTHQGKYQGRIAGAVIGARAAGVPLLETDRWGAHAATADHAAITQVVFTDPEICSAGLTLAQAEEAGLRVRAVDYEIGNVAGASLYADGYRGKARMVVDLDREIVVGVTFAGPGVGELVHSGAMAVAGELPIDRLWHVVPAYPTIGEIWLRLLETYRG